jgi:hypothetical protein
MNGSGSPRNALWVGSAAARFARRSSTNPQSAPASQLVSPKKHGTEDRKQLNLRCHSAVRQRISI